MNSALTLADLVDGLTALGDRYGELHVFADDVAEIRALDEDRAGDELVALDRSGRRFRFRHPAGLFILEIEETGIAKISRAADGSGTLAGALVGSVAGVAVGQAVSKKGKGWTGGLLVGMLVGAALGSSGSPSAPRRVLTMRFDPNTRRWSAYDGGLVAWIKNELAPAG